MSVAAAFAMGLTDPLCDPTRIPASLLHRLTPYPLAANRQLIRCVVRAGGV
jgi:hypothetical protein